LSLVARVTALAQAIAADIKSLTSGKVDKVNGKGLSTNDYTATDKNKLAGIADGAQVNSVTSVAGRAGAVTLAKADVGLGSVDNTADGAKPVSVAQQAALDAKVNTSNPVVTGNMSLFTQSSLSAGTSSAISVGRTRGTSLSPDPVLANDRLGAFQFQARGSDGLLYTPIVLEAYAAEDVGPSGAGSLFQFATTKSGSAARSVALQITSGGQVAMPGGFYTNMPGRPAQYTLTTLPSATAYSGYEIDVTNATGGPKRCRSNGTNWLILNTTTPVS